MASGRRQYLRGGEGRGHNYMGHNFIFMAYIVMASEAGVRLRVGRRRPTLLQHPRLFFSDRRCPVYGLHSYGLCS